MKLIVTAVVVGAGNQITTTLATELQGLQVTVVDSSPNPTPFTVGQEVYSALIDANSIGGHALSLEDELVHDVLDLVDVPRQIGGQVQALWQRLVHAATVARLDLTAHVKAVQGEVHAEMVKTGLAIGEASVATNLAANGADEIQAAGLSSAVESPVTGAAEVKPTPIIDGDAVADLRNIVDNTLQ